MKMYHRQRSRNSFVGLRGKTSSSEVIYVSSATQVVIIEANSVKVTEFRWFRGEYRRGGGLNMFQHKAHVWLRTTSPNK